MRRILLPIVLATFAFPAAAHASVLATVSNGTLTITGDAADDRIIVKPGSAGDVLVNDQSFAGVSKLAINSGAGADEIRIDSLALPATIESGPGADVIAGGPGPETIVAGDDADLVDGGAGQDKILLGAGNDTALETDGSVDGQSGTDTVRVTGTDESEEFTLQALGTHARIVRDTGGLADLVRVETAEVLGGRRPGPRRHRRPLRDRADSHRRGPRALRRRAGQRVRGRDRRETTASAPPCSATPSACPASRPTCGSRTRTPTASPSRPAAATTS